MMCYHKSRMHDPRMNHVLNQKHSWSGAPKHSVHKHPSDPELSVSTRVIEQCVQQKHIRPLLTIKQVTNTSGSCTEVLQYQQVE